MYWKIVDYLQGSPFCHSDLSVQYKVHKWVTAHNKWAMQGFHLFVYDNRESAENLLKQWNQLYEKGEYYFELKLYPCTVRDILPLPETLINMEKYITDKEICKQRMMQVYTVDTIMVKEIMLLKN